MATIFGIFFILILVSLVKSSSEKCKQCGTSESVDEYNIRIPDIPIELNFQADYSDEVLFLLYTRNNKHHEQRLILNDRHSLNSSYFDNRHKVYFLVHGWTEDYDSFSNDILKTNLLEVEDANVIIVDWSFYSKGLKYFTIASETPGVSRALKSFIVFLMQNNFPLGQIHLIGFSLGAHICGFTGKFLLKENDTLLPRVTGLDPAGEGFTKSIPEYRLSANDAQFVDCIHTCGNFFGIGKPICDADFFPNGGSCIQKGCPLSIGVCSHYRSTVYYAESILNDHKFIAVTCESVRNGVPKGCSNTGFLMGHPADNSSHGVFYSETNGKYPYATNRLPTLLKYGIFSVLF